MKKIQAYITRGNKHNYWGWTLDVLVDGKFDYNCALSSENDVDALLEAKNFIAWEYETEDYALGFNE